MDVSLVNKLLTSDLEHPESIFPRLVEVAKSRHVFLVDFGLKTLPLASGVLLVRGARQYGKSTWLEGQAVATFREFGPGSAYHLNGDEIGEARVLVDAIRALLPLYRQEAVVQRLFIDEITAISDWERALKVLADAGELQRILVVTSGSKATDLRQGGERLPGRKGKLDRTAYIFTPISYREFHRVCGAELGERTLSAYLLSGGSPVACSELAENGRLPEYVLEMTRDWVYGECALSGRSRASLLAVLDCVARHGTSPLSQAQLARDTGLANNTVAAGYLELLANLLSLASAFPWDASRRIRVLRRPAKHPFTNLLVAATWHPERPRSIEDIERLSPAARGSFWEWAVAQELWRRRAKRGEELPEIMAFWQSKEHEIDFVASADELLEVKAGSTSPHEFTWFARTFPLARLKVIGSHRFAAGAVSGVTMEDFLLEEE